MLRSSAPLEVVKVRHRSPSQDPGDNCMFWPCSSSSPAKDVDADRIVAEISGDEPPDGAHDSLYTYISNLPSGPRAGQRRPLPMRPTGSYPRIATRSTPYRLQCPRSAKPTVSSTRTRRPRSASSTSQSPSGGI